MNNSRFITYPSTVDANSNYKIVVVDALEQELEQLTRFLQTSIDNFDVYLYSVKDHDLEWLSGVSTNAKFVLINVGSQVSLNTLGIRYQNNLLEYFEQLEKSPVDN